MKRLKQTFMDDQRDQLKLVLPAALFALWAAFQLWSLTRYPAVTCDEGSYSQMAISFLGGLGKSAAWPGATYRFYLPHGRLYWLILGLVGAATRYSLYAGRLISLVGWGIAIMATYRLSMESGGDRRAALLASALVATSSVNMFVGHIVRPDMLAAGVAALLIALLPALRRRHNPLLYGLYGAALVATLDLHFNPVHLFWPAGLLIVLPLIRRRAWAHLGAFALGIGLSGLAWVVVHTGPILPQLVRDIALDPNAVANSYLGHSASTAIGQEILFRVVSFGRYWWKYFGSFVPFLFIPQGILFIVATFYALIAGDEHIRPVALIILGSSLSYAAINSRYQLVSYSVMWYPLYSVVAVWTVFDVAKRVPGQRAVLKMAPTVLCAGLVALNAGVDGYLARTSLFEQYEQDVSRLRAAIPAGSRIVTSMIWWHGLHADYEVVDEHVISMFDQVIDGRRTIDNILWIPPSESIAQDTRPAFIASIPASASPADRAEILTSQGLRPDYVLVDPFLGCEIATTDISLAYERYIEGTCEPVGSLTENIQPGAVLYHCTWD